jgi:stage III sporulation protein SpoIIIAA
MVIMTIIPATINSHIQRTARHQQLETQAFRVKIGRRPVLIVAQKAHTRVRPAHFQDHPLHFQDRLAVHLGFARA